MTIEPTKEMLEAGARALMILDGCGLTIEGERVFCDDPRAMAPNDSCVCKAGARAAIEAAFAADAEARRNHTPGFKD